MVNQAYIRHLHSTYRHRVSAFRPLPEGGEAPVCRMAPCALSRTAKTASPAPANFPASLPETQYSLTLYTAPDLVFQAGDRLEILDERGRMYRADSADSFCYPTHSVTVVRILEVLEMGVSV